MPDLGDSEGIEGAEPEEIESRHDSLYPEALRDALGDPALEARRDGESQAENAQVLIFPHLPKMYEGFVKGKWKTTLRRGNPFFRLNDSDSYFKAYENYINAIFARPSTRLRIAVLSSDADIAFGWSVVSGSTLHYVYVSPEYRGRGLSRLLVPSDIDKITHLTLIGKSLWRQKMPAVVFDMFA